VEEEDALTRIKYATANAERIIFLGFAFHRQNVDLIAASTLGDVQVLATALDISKSDQSVIEEELATAFEFHDPLNRPIELAEVTCAKLFQDYWRTLTADAQPDWAAMGEGG
jgi:hypothetical protein